MVTSVTANSTLKFRDAWEPETDLREWRVEVGGVVKSASDALTVTFIHIEDNSYNSPAHPSHLVLKDTSCSLHPFFSLHFELPHSPSFPCVWVVRATFQAGFTLLGDGPVAVALVVRWSACLARWGGLEGGGRGRRRRQEQAVDRARWSRGGCGWSGWDSPPRTCWSIHYLTRVWLTSQTYIHQI